MTPLEHARELIALREKAMIATGIKESNSLFDDYNEKAISHAAEVAEALITAEAKIATIKQAFAEWESVRTFRNDINSHEWLALIAAMED